MKRDKTFKQIEDTAKDFCKRNNISHDEYIKTFINTLLKQYYFDREVYQNEKENYKSNSHSRAEYEFAYYNFHNSRIDLFEWLDTIEDFTFFILNPVYLYAPRSIHDSKFKHQKIEWTGLQNTDILQDYINYKFN